MVSETIAEKSAPKPRSESWRLWAARGATVLAALATFTASAASGHPRSSIPVLITHGAVLARLVRKYPSPGAYGMQMGVGTAGAAFGLGFFLELLGFGAWVGEFLPTLCALLFATILNFLMFRSAFDVPMYLAWDRKARVDFLSNTLFMIVVASGCWYVLLKALG